jgi:hypothetical protein
MPPSPRYTVRLPPALDTQVQARVRAGTPFAGLIRDALAAYLADTVPTGMPTDTPIPADSADTIRNLQEQLSALTTRVEILEQMPTRRRQAADRSADRRADRPLTGADTPAVPADRPLTGADTAPAYDPDVACARMQALQAQGLTLAQIAAQLTAEGLPTKQGRPWHKSTVNYLLKTRGR